MEQTVHYKSLSPSASFNRLLETVTHQSRTVGLPHWSTRSAWTRLSHWLNLISIRLLIGRTEFLLRCDWSTWVRKLQGLTCWVEQVPAQPTWIPGQTWGAEEISTQLRLHLDNYCHLDSNQQPPINDQHFSITHEKVNITHTACPSSDSSREHTTILLGWWVISRLNIVPLRPLRFRATLAQQFSHNVTSLDNQIHDGSNDHTKYIHHVQCFHKWNLALRTWGQNAL